MRAPNGFVLLLPALAFFWLGAGAPAGARAERDTPRLRPIIEALAVDTTLTIDRVLDDPAWQQAPKSGEFFQRQPVEFAPASEATEVQVAYTPRILYAENSMSAPR